MASDHPLRVFLDTNVIYSGLYTPRGTTGGVLQLATAGAFVPVISGHVIRELVNNLTRRAAPVLLRAESFFRNAAIEVVGRPDDETVLYWTNRGLTTDARVAAAANLAQVDYLCTGDAKFRDIVLAAPEGPPVLTPRQMLDLLTL
jgi:predicted nucleic acid-binding protein